jgi:hypothetical protein
MAERSKFDFSDIFISIEISEINHKCKDRCFDFRNIFADKFGVF